SGKHLRHRDASRQQSLQRSAFRLVEQRTAGSSHREEQEHHADAGRVIRDHRALNVFTLPGTDIAGSNVDKTSRECSAYLRSGRHYCCALNQSGDGTLCQWIRRIINKFDTIALGTGITQDAAAPLEYLDRSSELAIVNGPSDSRFVVCKGD